MTNFATQINRLQSQNKNIRYDACEQLRVAEHLPPAAVTALKQLMYDTDPLVADAASRALLAHPQVEAAPTSPLSQPAGSAWIGHTSITGSAEDVAQMYRSIRGWAIVSIVLGAISIFSLGGLDPAWGLLMVAIGLLSWKVKIPGMFALYAVLMGWAVIMNALSVIGGSGIFWLPFAGLQVFWTISILKQLHKYRRLPLQEMYDSQDWPADLPAPQDATRISGRFAVASSLLALPSLLMPAFACLVIIGIAAMQGEANIPAPAETTPSFDWLTYVLSGVVDMAVLSLGLGIAALVSNTRRRGLAFAGVSVSALTLFSWLVLLVIINLVSMNGIPQISS